MICGKVVIALTAALACAVLAHATGISPASGLIRAPDGKGGFIYREPSTETEGTEADTPMQESPTDIIPGPISYHGGPIMLGTTKVYRIWYGWQGGPPQTPNSPPFHTGWVMQGLILGLSGSSYFNINAAYSDGSGNHVSNSLIDGGSIYLPTSATFGGTSLNGRFRLQYRHQPDRQPPAAAVGADGLHGCHRAKRQRNLWFLHPLLRLAQSQGVFGRRRQIRIHRRR